ncbi:MAG: hypothetical protein IJR01_01335 [Bacteroidales bacterium]|nr:hypothetical protein [Bacteroidales bacterium]
MKALSILLRSMCPVLAIASAFLFLTAGSCSSSNDNRPNLTDKYPNKWDIPIDYVSLRYDLGTFINNCMLYGSTYPAADIQELTTYNNLFSTAGTLNFYTLFVNTDRFTGVGPTVKFIFSVPDCKGPVSITYNSFDDKLCNENTIVNAPKITKTHIVDFSARTLKTSQNNIYIKWNKEYTVSGVGSYITIDRQGTVDYPSYMFTTGTKGGNQAAGRIVDGHLELVENTLSRDLVIGDYHPVIINDTPVVSDVLQQGVNMSGALNNDLNWDRPMIVELQTR